MAGKLTFASTAQERDTISRETGALAVSGPSETRRMLDHLRDGGSAVAVMSPMMTGFRVPDGVPAIFLKEKTRGPTGAETAPWVEIDFTESCPRTGPERLQAEGRRRPGGVDLYPHQQRVVDRLHRSGETVPSPVVHVLDPADMDARIERMIAGKSRVTVVAEAHHIKDPFDAERAPLADADGEDPAP